MIVAAVPLKSLDRAKSRLAPYLTPGERSALAVALLQRVVEALRSSGAVDSIALVTSEASLAHHLDLELLPDRGDLNRSLHGAIHWALSIGAGSLMVVPADLPLLAPDDLVTLAEALDGQTGVTLAPTRDGGTGGMLLTPPNAISPSFGRSSFSRHLALARDSGLLVSRVTSPGFLYDLDTLEDLRSVAPSWQTTGRSMGPTAP